MQLLKQSTAATIKIGPFVDSSDGVSPETGLTISQADIQLSKNGGAFAQTNNATGATHDALGWYGVPLDTTDTNTLGRLTVMIYETGALPVFMHFMVVPANVYDALVGGSDALQVDLTQIAGSTTIDTVAIATVLERLLAFVSGKTVRTDNEDGTYDLAFRNQADDANIMTITYDLNGQWTAIS